VKPIGSAMMDFRDAPLAAVSARMAKCPKRQCGDRAGSCVKSSFGRRRVANPFGRLGGHCLAGLQRGLRNSSEANRFDAAGQSHSVLIRGERGRPAGSSPRLRILAAQNRTKALDSGFYRHRTKRRTSARHVSCGHGNGRPAKWVIFDSVRHRYQSRSAYLPKVHRRCSDSAATYQRVQFPLRLAVRDSTTLATRMISLEVGSHVSSAPRLGPVGRAEQPAR
jgi:hypothetical protein